METPKSPCTGRCKLGANGYCIGCFRNSIQIDHWQYWDDNAKRIIIEQAAERRRKFDEDLLG